MQIEAGKYYRSAAGVKVGPMERYGDDCFFGSGHCVVFQDGSLSSNPQMYRADGSVYRPRAGEELHHLVSEWSKSAQEASVHDISRDLASMTDRATKAEAERDELRSRLDAIEKNSSEIAQAATKINTQMSVVFAGGGRLFDENIELRKRVDDLLEANNRYLERARASDAAVDQLNEAQGKIEGLEAELSDAVEVAFKNGAYEWVHLNYPDHYKRLALPFPDEKQTKAESRARPMLRNCPMCGADGNDDEEVGFFAHLMIANECECETSYEVRCFGCGIEVRDEYADEAVRLWNGEKIAADPDFAEVGE